MHLSLTFLAVSLVVMACTNGAEDKVLQEPLALAPDAPVVGFAKGGEEESPEEHLGAYGEEEVLDNDEEPLGEEPVGEEHVAEDLQDQDLRQSLEESREWENHITETPEEESYAHAAPPPSDAEIHAEEILEEGEELEAVEELEEVSLAQEAINAAVDDTGTSSYSELLAAPTPAGEEDYWVNALSLNVRKGPGAKHPKTRALKKGEKVSILERSGEWVKINPGEWVLGAYLSAKP